MDCVFCREDGGEVLWSDDSVGVVLADEPEWPGFCRVIWHAHVAEMSDLDNAARLKVMTAVNGVERAICRVLAPAKINLASLGNQVPHVHWHVIPTIPVFRAACLGSAPAPGVSSAAVQPPRPGYVAARSGARRNDAGVWPVTRRTRLTQARGRTGMTDYRLNKGSP